MGRKNHRWAIFCPNEIDIFTMQNGMYWNDDLGWVPDVQQASTYSTNLKNRRDAIPGIDSQWVMISPQGKGA